MCGCGTLEIAHTDGGEVLGQWTTVSRKPNLRTGKAGVLPTSYRLILAISSSIWCCAAIPPPSWFSPRSAMDTADESREPTEGRRMACGVESVESEVDRDWKFMAPRGRPLDLLFPYIRATFAHQKKGGRGASYQLPHVGLNIKRSGCRFIGLGSKADVA
jgi:hypothetical protein